jgi:predicted AAA+ superfamily ATPase
MYYFRDNVGNELDLITERDENPLAIEIKSVSKFDNTMLRGLHFWKKNQSKASSILLDGGSTAQTLSGTMSIAQWTKVANI